MVESLKEQRAKYHDRPEWSYSQMKVILDSGIDYAVAAKRKLLPAPESKAIDIGTLVHQAILGGDEQFVISPYDNFRTKAAQEWRDQQLEMQRIVIKKEDSDIINQIATNIKNHPLYNKYLGKDKKAFHELELTAKADGVALRGKADYLRILPSGGLIITDIKTTAKFDEFFRKAQWSHYDLQAAVYSLIGTQATNSKQELTNYYFCVAETVAPFRVQFMHASLEFVEAGERKLRKCLDEIKEFGDREPNFLLETVRELGDYSL